MTGLRGAKSVPPKLASIWAVSTWLSGLIGLLGGCLRAGDVGGEEVDAVAVEVAAGAVVVLGGAGVGVSGEDLGVAERYADVERALVMAACRSECGLMWSGGLAVLAMRRTMR